MCVCTEDFISGAGDELGRTITPHERVKGAW